MKKNILYLRLFLNITGACACRSGLSDSVTLSRNPMTSAPYARRTWSCLCTITIISIFQDSPTQKKLFIIYTNFHLQYAHWGRQNWDCNWLDLYIFNDAHIRCPAAECRILHPVKLCRYRWSCIRDRTKQELCSWWMILKDRQLLFKLSMDGKHSVRKTSQMLCNMFYTAIIILFYLADQICVMHNDRLLMA